MADNNIQITIEVLDKASANVKNVADNIGKNLSNAKSSVLDFSSSATIASVGFAATLGKTASEVIGAGAKMQQLSVAFETLTGSSQKAADMMVFLQQQALKSPLDFEEITTATQRMLAFGFTAEEVKKNIPGLIDSVSALGMENGKLSGIILALGQMHTKQIVKQQEINQLQERGVAVTDMLAQAIQQNLIHVNGLSKGVQVLGGATKSQTSANEKATDSIGKLNAQIAVQEEKMKKAKDAGKSSTAQLNLMQATLDGLRAKAADANGAISTFANANQDAGKKINFAGASLETIKSKLGEVADMKIPGDQAAVAIMKIMSEKYMGAASKQMETFSGQMSNLHDVFLQTAAAIVGWTPQGTKAGGILDILTKNLILLNATLQNATPQLIRFTEWMTGNKVAMEVLAAVLAGLLLPALLLLVGPIVLLIQAVAPFVIGFLAIVAAVEAVNYAMQQSPALFAVVAGAIAGLAAFLFTLLIPSITAATISLGIFLAGLAGTALAAAPFIIAGVALGLALAGIVGWLKEMGILDNISISFQNLVEPVKAIIDKYDMLGVKAREAANATRDLKTASDEYDALTSQYERQITMVAQATLNHETAVKNLNIAKKKYAEGSPEVQQADINEKQAKYNLTDQTNKLHEITGKIPDAYEKMNKAQDTAKATTENLTTSVEKNGNAWKDLTDLIGNAIGKLAEYYGKAVSGPGGQAMFNGITGHAHGGLVPGPIDAPTPIIAHGGERVIPRTGMDVNGYDNGGGGLTVNFNAPVNMDSDERVNQLAKLVIDQLGRQNELARYGVGY